MGLKIRIEDEDYPGISETCSATSIQTVFIDAEKSEVIVISDGKAITISL